jgi:hypothetical protein
MEVEGVAKRHGIDLERVIAIYKRSPDTGFFPVLVPFQTNLDRAIAILGKNKALQLFETEDLSKLEERVFLVDEINFSPPPLYSLDELQQVLEDFISYLLKNRVHLLETGQPLTKFDRSLWLDSQLANLYHFDFPRGFPPPPKKDSDRLKADRGKILDLKVAILKILSRAIKRKASMNLWNDCLRILTETVSSEEAEFYLRMDQFYIGYDVTDRTDKGAPEEIPGLDRPGGFTDLLEVIGHIEKELTIGTLAETRNALADLLTFGQWNRPLLFVSNYFEATEHPLRDTLDSALDLFSYLELKESDFWENYPNRVKEALENEFYGDFIYRDKVKRKFIHQFEPQATNFLKLMKSYFEATGRPPRISISEDEDTKIQGQYVFHQEGQIWTTTYNGITKRFEDAKGFHYIAYLLENPWKEIRVLDLVAAVEKQTGQSAGSIYGNMSEEQLEKYGLRSSNLDDSGEILDKKADKAYKLHLEMLREQYEANLSNPEKAAEIKEEIDFIKRERSTSKVGGRIRKFSSEKEKAEKKVSKAIFRCLKIIKNGHPDLYIHLNKALRPITDPLRYSPDRPIDWITQ